MKSSHRGHDPYELRRLLSDHAALGESHRALAMMVERLFVEVEALRAALADATAPEAVRRRYRKAYKQTAISAHCSAGAMGGTILSEFFRPTTAQYEEDVTMLERLGMSPDEVKATRAEVQKVSRYT